MNDHIPRIGDVYQILDTYEQKGWVGAFIMVSEVKPWGVQGFVHHIVSQDECGFAFNRIKYEHLAYIGHSVLVADSITEEDDE